MADQQTRYFRSKRAFLPGKFPVLGVVTLPVVAVDSFVGIVVEEPCPVALHPDFLRVEGVAVPRTSKELLLVVVEEGQVLGACSIDPSAGAEA